MKLLEVSKTAFMTLGMRVVESEQKNPIIKDHMAILLLDRLIYKASEDDRKWILENKKRYGNILYSFDRRAIARRGKKFDNIVNKYISDNPGCTVINLGCGFDTRFWRIENKKCRYIEIDIPEVIELKKELLSDYIYYQLIGCSVLDTVWMEEVISKGNSNFLFIAEGLFMYLQEPEVEMVLKTIVKKFNHSQISLDIVPPLYTKGFGKYIINWSYKNFLGLDVSFTFGKNPKDMESYANGLKVFEVEKIPLEPLSIVSMSINEK
jgi:methyltransferase (TIGR00027 family)